MNGCHLPFNGFELNTALFPLPGVRPTPAMPHSLNSLSTVARSGNAAQTSSSDEEACTAQGAEVPFVSTTAVPTSGMSTHGDDMGSDDMAPTFADVVFWQLPANCILAPQPY